VDENARKQRDYIAIVLGDAAILILVVLANLDGIGLILHTQSDGRDRTADDYMMVIQNILPTVDADERILALIRSLLLDWVNLDSLLYQLDAGNLTGARADAAEELANRVSVTLTVAGEQFPGLFGLSGD
jgi:hypothetical protein